jgi:hypothetical protein
MPDHRTAPAFQVVKRNVATGGPVAKVFRARVGNVTPGGAFCDRDTARRVADRFNAREGREGRNVCWTVREVAR